MCRLLGYATRTPTTLAALLGEDDLAAFTELARKHGDGWGLARPGSTGTVVDKAPDSALTSAGFARAAHEGATDLAVVHLRWATLGLPVVERNAHPFTDGAAAFAHNGSIRPPHALETLLSEPVRARLSGDTDSERFFGAVLSRLEGDLSDPVRVASAYAQAAAAVADGFLYSSLNSMLLTPTHLYALCAYREDAELEEAEPDYYRLRYRVDPEAVVVTSSGWGDGWEELDNGQLMVVERGSLAVSVLDLPAAAEAA